jgi:hypothetical protein
MEWVNTACHSQQGCRLTGKLKTKILLCLVVGIMLPSLLLAQTAGTADTSGFRKSGHPAAKKANIVSFHVENEGKGALRIIYSN